MFYRIAHSAWFQNAVIGVIVMAGILVGLETYGSITSAYGPILHVLDQLVLWIFVAEAVIKILAHGNQPWRYFQDPWNVFDFTIVAVCFLPFHAEFIAVLRLARILRVFKLVTALPRLQLIVSALLRSIPSMVYVIILLLLHFYIYAVLGTFSFGANDPFHFGSLQRSMLTLFQIVTLEGWADILSINMYGCDRFGYESMMEQCTNPSAAPVGAVLFFVSFILLGTMIILNLFIGVIMNAMGEVIDEAAIKERARSQTVSLKAQIGNLSQKLTEIQNDLNIIMHRVDGESGVTSTVRPVDRT